jgi:hypothetical protein
MQYEFEYVVSPRVTLRPGDKFRVKGGPFWRAELGKVPLSAARGGVFVFVRVAVHRTRKVIEAFDSHGHFAPLHVEGRRRTACKQIVPRPYRVTGKVRGPRVSRSKGRNDG